MSFPLSILKKAKKLLYNEKYSELIDLLQSPSLKEDKVALYLLGNIYSDSDYTNNNIEINLEKALACYTGSARKGFSRSYYELGNIYYLGKNVKTDYSKAREYWLKASDFGNIFAMFDLANLISEAFPEDIDTAIDLYHDLIDLNEFSGNCYTKLGRIFDKGIGVKKDHEKANHYFKKGAELGNLSCLSDLALVYFKGKTAGKNLRKSLEFIEKAGPQYLLYDEVNRSVFNKMNLNKQSV